MQNYATRVTAAVVLPCSPESGHLAKAAAHPGVLPLPQEQAACALSGAELRGTLTARLGT